MGIDGNNGAGRLCAPSTRLVFDRKKTATNRKAALVQVEVLYERRKKYFTTGVKVMKNQWSAKTGVCNRFDMAELNRRIGMVKARIDAAVNGVMEDGGAFSFERLERCLAVAQEREKTFIEFVSERIDGRSDIRESTKKTQRKLVGSLEEFGRIKYFSDLNRKNIMDYDDFLHSKGIRQSTVWSYHKFMKTYVNDAINRGLLDSNPYAGFAVKRGESEHGRWLSAEELDMLEAARMPTESLGRARDLFVLQCLTGLAYSDLMKADFSKAKEEGGICYLEGDREKTGAAFCAVLLPKAMEIIKRFGGKLPSLSNQQYNMRLKVVADAAGIGKPIASHWGRRTRAMLLLNRGVSMETVSKVLGHTSIRTTESAYAKLLSKAVVEEVGRKLGGQSRLCADGINGVLV